MDTGARLAGYFRVPSIQHYLILVTERTMTIHHRRIESGGIETRMVASGRVEMDPPGIVVTIEDLFAE